MLKSSQNLFTNSTQITPNIILYTEVRTFTARLPVITRQNAEQAYLLLYDCREEAREGSPRGAKRARGRGGGAVFTH